MSKSKNNTVDPLETIEKYGADALRFFMAASETQGRDINISDSRIAGYRNFATKLWNAARFCEMNECHTNPSFNPKGVAMDLNKWIIQKADEATLEVTKNLNDFRFSDAANTVYQFVWGTFCDWFIELSKPVFYGEDENQKQETRSTAAYVLDRILVILHPFMPFITTEIWNKTANRSVKLIHAPWPKVEEKAAKQNAIDWAIDLISSVRSLRSDLNLPAGAKPHLFLKDLKADNIAQTSDMVKTLAHVEDVALLSGDITKDMVQGTFAGGVFLIPLKGIVDFESERARLQKEIAAVEGRIKGYEAKLSNENFVSRAPAQIVEDEKKRLSEAKEEHLKLNDAFNRIKDL
jgi:valyl-tRNA synthetase